MSAGIFARVIGPQEFALGLSQLGIDGSNPSPSSAESANFRFLQPVALAEAFGDVFSDETDIRPTILSLAGLKDDYAHDGRCCSRRSLLRPFPTRCVTIRTHSRRWPRPTRRPKCPDSVAALLTRSSHQYGPAPAATTSASDRALHSARGSPNLRYPKHASAKKQSASHIAAQRPRDRSTTTTSPAPGVSLAAASLAGAA
jgi:hypothetical protein